MSQKHDPFSSLRFADFRLFLFARLFSTVGTQIQATIVGWQLYTITHSALSLGMIGLAEAIPAIGLALFGGLLADSRNRKYIVLSCYIGLCLSALVLLSFSYHMDAWIPKYGTLPIYLAIVINGISRGFLSPAMFSFLSQMVPKNEYINSTTWNSTIWQMASITGPALGGLLYAWQNATFCYSTVLGLLIMALIMVFLISPKPNPVVNKAEPIRTRLFSGIHFVFNSPIILGAISLDLFAVLFGGAVALLPVYASDILHVGAEGLGMLRAAPAAGSTLMALLLAVRKPLKNAGHTLLIAVAGFGITTIVFGISEIFWLSLLMLFLGGVFDTVSVVIRSVILQLKTPDEMRGRVSAVNSIFIGSSNEIGAFESGFAASLLGTMPSVVFGGCMTLVVVAITYIKAPSLRKLDLKALSGE